MKFFVCTFKFLAAPGLLTQMKPCIVYENKYIDCKIRAPTMVSAIHNQYPYYFDFIEIQQSFVEILI